VLRDNMNVHRPAPLAIVTAIMLVEAAAAGQRRLTLSEAEGLAHAALSGVAPSSVTLLPPPLPSEKGVTFYLVWRDARMPPVRELLVDIDTGEVWDGHRCEPFTTTALLNEQRKIRRRLNISADEIFRAFSAAKQNGCGNLVDERPRPEDFGPVRLTTVSVNENQTAYHYLMVMGDMQYQAVSPAPIKICEGTLIRFLKTRTAMYVIDEDGTIREVYDELQFDSQHRK
jgi:hypothetical protein